MAKFDLNAGKVVNNDSSLDQLRTVLINKMDMITETKIKMGFDHVVNDKTYHFSYNNDDQSNFAQQCIAATMSMQLGTMSKEDLKKTYGTDDNNEIWYDNMPVALPEKFKVSWQGHKPDGGVDALILGLQDFLRLANAGGNHLKTCLGYGWVVKEKLRACTNVKQLHAVEQMFKIEDTFRQMCVE